KRDNLEDSLRSEALRPAGATRDHNGWRSMPTAENVSALAEARAALLCQEGNTLPPVDHDLSGGRLLWVDPSLGINTGAVQVETSGFIDYDDIPAWDTWICWVSEETDTSSGGYLLCWIPPAFVQVVEYGMAVSCTEPFRWASGVVAPFLRRLRATKLLAWTGPHPRAALRQRPCP